MSSDFSMSSDDERPLGAKPTSHPNSNGHVTNANANGNKSKRKEDYSPMSEDEGLPSQASTAHKPPSTSDSRSLKRKKAMYTSSEEDVPSSSMAPSSPAKQIRSAAVPMPGAVAATSVPSNGKNNGKASKPPSKSRKELDDSEDSDDAPLAPSKKAPVKPAKKKPKKENEDDPFGDAAKASAGTKPGRKNSNGKPRKSAADNDSGFSSDDDKPLSNKQAAKKRVKKEELDGDDTPKVKKPKAKREEMSASPKKKAKKEEADEEEEVFKWWEQEGDPEGDGSTKWQTLEHNGVYFPPPYEALPSGVKMKYNGQDVDLPPASEEVAGFYGALLETDHAKDATFNKNFFTDFVKVLKKNPPRNGVKIERFELCDFRPMYEHFETIKAEKKAMSSAEKKELKKAKDALELKYTTCLLDGRKEKVGNFRIEPPGLFRGRGEHPKKGTLKLRVRPEDITINIGDDVPIPEPNMPGTWKKVIHDHTVTWLANWTENVNGQHKYVFLAAGSSLKGQSDMSKFEKARELKSHVDRIRQDYNSDLKSKMMAARQRATAMYFIDRLALRAGNEKGEDEADTVGCCSLRCEHVTLEQPNFIIFDFLGKDSIRYYKRVEVEEQIFKNIRIFKENKTDEDALFDRVTTTLLNKHLQSYMKGLTAKVFRTYNASITFQQQLDEYTPAEGTVQEKLVAYNKANRMVAILCNHQRSVPKGHMASMEKMQDKLRALKYDRMKLRHVLFDMDSKYKKKKQYADDESDIDDEWIETHEKSLKEKEYEKLEKKFEKENEKLKAEGGEIQKESVLRERKKAVDEEFDRLESERGTGKATLKRARPVEKIEEGVEKLTEKIKAFKLQMVDREEGKEVSLGTSKINYLDPRITTAWCKTNDVPIEKLFSKTLLTKFPWAMEVEGDWKF